MSYKRPSWKRDFKISRNSKTPCGYLIQRHPCQRSECDFSHDTRLVQKWQSQLDEARTCKWGENCSHNQDGNCFYYHPPEHGKARPVLVLCGLEFMESLDLDSLVVDQDVCIEDEADLASFNKVSDDEIIVPGEQTQPIHYWMWSVPVLIRDRIAATLLSHRLPDRHQVGRAQPRPDLTIPPVHARV